jgi:hypothetical protein
LVAIIDRKKWVFRKRTEALLRIELVMPDCIDRSLYPRPPTLMPQKIVLTDAKAISCTYVPVTENGKVGSGYEGRQATVGMDKEAALGAALARGDKGILKQAVLSRAEPTFSCNRYPACAG